HTGHNPRARGSRNDLQKRWFGGGSGAAGATAVRGTRVTVRGRGEVAQAARREGPGAEVEVALTDDRREVIADVDRRGRRGAAIVNAIHHLEARRVERERAEGRVARRGRRLRRDAAHRD